MLVSERTTSEKRVPASFRHRSLTPLPPPLSAHCASTGEATGSNGCSTGTRPEGTEVNITGATRPGKVSHLKDSLSLVNSPLNLIFLPPPSSARLLLLGKNAS